MNTKDNPCKICGWDEGECDGSDWEEFKYEKGDIVKLAPDMARSMHQETVEIYRCSYGWGTHGVIYRVKTQFYDIQALDDQCILGKIDDL